MRLWEENVARIEEQPKRATLRSDPTLAAGEPAESGSRNAAVFGATGISPKRVNLGSARLVELDAALGMDESISRNEEEVGNGERPSVLEDLKKRAAKIPPDKSPGRS